MSEHRAVANLRANQRQLDMDGCEVGVSRQALDETLALLTETGRALNGLIGLVQLVRGRDDCPPEIRRVLADQYRLDDAYEAVGKLAGEQL